MKAFILFEMPITLAFQKVFSYFCTINSFWFIGKHILIIGIKLPIINTFLPIYKKKFIIQKQKSAFWKASLMGFSKSINAFI